MLFAASTIKDSLANVRFFVAANLDSGLDHLVVFLDAPREPDQREVRAFLDEHPHVTCIPTGRSWWDGDRPASLNVRQRINANVVLALLEDVDEVDWVVHLDGDEVLAVDPAALAAVPADAPALWLSPLEAVSTFAPPERPTSFKRLLGEDDLLLLNVLGVLGEATNQAYFHGHVLGKSGVRPRSGLRLTLHDPVRPDGERVPPTDRFEHPGLRLLHFDAVSGEEFVRKWRTMAAAGPVATRPDRAPLARGLRRLVELDLPDAVAARYLRRVYEATTQDDVVTLAELDLLEHVDPSRGTHEPRPFSTAASAHVAGRLEELRAAPKRPFHVNHGSPQAAGAPGPGARGRTGRLGRRVSGS